MAFEEKAEYQPPIKADNIPELKEENNNEADLEVIEKAVKGDKEAFSALFMKTYRQMYYVARKILRNDEDIYDALQNGYIKAYKYMSRLSAADMFLPWLRKTIENAALDVYKDISAHGAVSYEDESAADAATSDETEDSERRADIAAVLMQMDSRRAEVLTLYYYDGMRIPEIAKLLGEPQSTVYSRLNAAKKELSSLLKIRGIDKSTYGGGVGTMIAICLRTLIGTDVLSAATAQRMLDDIVSGRHGKLGAAAYQVLKKQRDRAILKAVTILMVLTVLVSCLTVGFIEGVPQRWFVAVFGTSSGEGTAPSESANGESPEDDGGNWWNPFDKDETERSESNYSNDASRPSESDSDTSSEPHTSGGDNPSNENPPSVFAPDYKPGEANTEKRNQTAYYLNSNKNSYLDFQGDWVYFFGGGSSYKKRRDGTGSKIPLNIPNVQGSNPTVIGDWIYYRADSHTIMRMRTDGAVTEAFVERPAPNSIGINFYIQGGYLYYDAVTSGFVGGSTSEHRKISLSSKQDTKAANPWQSSQYGGIIVGGSLLENGYCLYNSTFKDEPFKWDKSDSATPLFLLGKTFYTDKGYYLDITNEANPQTGRLPVPLKNYRIEFADEKNNRFAVSVYDDAGIEYKGMKWYSKSGAMLGDVPKALWRKTADQYYQTDGKGYVYFRTGGKWYSCKTDGTKYVEYK